MEIAATYQIPFMDRAIIASNWARSLGRRGNLPDLVVEGEKGGWVTWDYGKHGLLPWMEFFYDWRFADLIGDGKIDMLLINGAVRQVAYRQDGTVLWRYDDPSATAIDVRMDSNFAVMDIDRDGVPELIGPRMVDGVLHLCLINARTGALKKSIIFPDREGMPERPAGGYLRCSATVINARGNPTPEDILLYWDYRALLLLDNDLNILWRRLRTEMPERKHRVFGHTPHAADINGDGHDEILASSVLLDKDANVLWCAPDHPALVQDGHADSVRIVRLRDDGAPNMVMSTGAYCFSAQGELLWGRDELLHGQAQRVGKIRDDIPGNQVIVYEGVSRVIRDKPDRVLALTNEGELVWDMTLFQPSIQEGGHGFWLGDWDGDGLDEVFVNDPDKVMIINGHGEIIDTIPGHLIYVFDLVGDGRSEAVIVDGIYPGFQLKVVTNNAPNPNPATNQVITHRETTEDMYNCTRY